MQTEEEIKKSMIECDSMEKMIGEKLDLIKAIHEEKNKSNLFEIIQKHAFIYTIIIFIGILIGVIFSKVVFEKSINLAINLQRFEYKGDIFDVHPSQVVKYFDSKKVNNTSVEEPVKNEVKNEVKKK